MTQMPDNYPDFAGYLHNPLSKDYHSENMKIATYIVKQRDGKYISEDSTDSNIYSLVNNLKMCLKDFENRKALEDKGLGHFLKLLVEKVKLDQGCLIGEILYCSDELPDFCLESEQVSDVLSSNFERPKDILLTKYTNPSRKELDITIKSVCRAFLREYFNDSEEIEDACKKMIQRVISK